MAKWDATKARTGFHTTENQRSFLQKSPDDQSVLFSPTPFELEPSRKKIVSRIHGFIGKQWVNGGCLEVFYRYHNQSGIAVPVESGQVLAGLERASRNHNLPPQIAGCSIEYLRDQGIWHENLQSFGDAIYSALSQGGAYTNSKTAIPDDQAKEQTSQYIEALFGDVPESELFFFGLDIGFSSWFWGVYWDFAYIIGNSREQWFAVIAATDTD